MKSTVISSPPPSAQQEGQAQNVARGRPWGKTEIASRTASWINVSKPGQQLAANLYSRLNTQEEEEIFLQGNFAQEEASRVHSQHSQLNPNPNCEGLQRSPPAS